MLVKTHSITYIYIYTYIQAQSSTYGFEQKAVADTQFTNSQTVSPDRGIASPKVKPFALDLPSFVWRALASRYSRLFGTTFMATTKDKFAHQSLLPKQACLNCLCF